MFFGLKSQSSSSENPAVGDLMTHFEYVSCGPTSVVGIQVAKPGTPPSWTFVPLEFNQHQGYMPSLRRAGTMNTNLGNAKHEALLGEDEGDEYFEDDHSMSSRLKRGVNKFLAGFPNPFKMADEFVSAACPTCVLLLAEKLAQPQEMIKAERAFEKNLTMMMRLFGVVLMYTAIVAIFSPLRKLFAYLWFVGAILNTGIHIIACSVTVMCSSCTIGLAYLAYRPLWSLLYFAIVGTAIYFLFDQQHQVQYTP